MDLEFLSGNSFFSPLPLIHSPREKGKCEKIDRVPFHVIPAQSAIQCFLKYWQITGPRFHRGDDLNSMFSQLQGRVRGFGKIGLEEDLSARPKNQGGGSAKVWRPRPSSPKQPRQKSNGRKRKPGFCGKADGGSRNSPGASAVIAGAGFHPGN